MPRTVYCKKCKAEMPPGQRCPRCGAKLSKSAVHLTWQVEHIPLRDWISWNAALRILIPVLTLVLALALLLEALSGGLRAAERLLLGGFAMALLGILLIACVLLLLLFLLQGEEGLRCEISGRGLRVQRILYAPSRWDLLLRLQSPALLAQTNPGNGLLALPAQEIAWKEIRRVQLWPEKSMILIYRPAHWLRLALPCDPFLYGEALDFIHEKLEKRKDVLLPPELRIAGSGERYQPLSPPPEAEERFTPNPATELPEELPLNEMEEADDVRPNSPEAL